MEVYKDLRNRLRNKQKGSVVQPLQLKQSLPRIISNSAAASTHFLGIAYSSSPIECIGTAVEHEITVKDLEAVLLLMWCEKRQCTYLQAVLRKGHVMTCGVNVGRAQACSNHYGVVMSSVDVRA